MPRNLVLVTADSLRADHCGFIDSEVDLTPTLDQLADDGVVYETALATGPRTPSSMPAAFTGEYLPPVMTDDGDYWQVLRRHIRRHLARHRTLPERLQADGYTTIGFSVNPWTENAGFHRGFDEFYTLNSEFLEGYGSPVFRLADRALRGNRFGASVKWFNKREWFIRWPDFYDAILERVRQAPSPYFLWVFLLDTHQPYISPANYRQESSAFTMYYATFRELLMNDGHLSSRVDRWLQQAYRDSIRSIDGFVNRLLTDLQTDDPAFIFHSDHGEAFGAHGSYGHEQVLHRENVHVPLLHHDGDSNNRFDGPVSMRRLPEIVSGMSQPDRFNPKSIVGDAAVSTSEDGRLRSAGTARWHLIRDGPDIALYDLRRDPTEHRDVSRTHPQVAEALEAALERHAEDEAERIRIGTAVEDRLTIEEYPVVL